MQPFNAKYVDTVFFNYLGVLSLLISYLQQGMEHAVGFVVSGEKCALGVCWRHTCLIEAAARIAIVCFLNAVYKCSYLLTHPCVIARRSFFVEMLATSADVSHERSRAQRNQQPGHRQLATIMTSLILVASLPTSGHRSVILLNHRTCSYSNANRIDLQCAPYKKSAGPQSSVN